MNFNRVDEFVKETAFLWFLALIMTFGFLKWLLIWACYELLMMVLVDEKPKKKKKKKKQKESEPEIIDEVEEAEDKKYI